MSDVILNKSKYCWDMALVTTRHTCSQGRQPWIEKDLMKILPGAQFQKFEGNLLIARLVISENGEYFLQDGLHRISAIFSSNCGDSSEGSLPGKMNNLENGMAVKILDHSYNIIKAKDGTFQFFICVDNWEKVTDDMPCFQEHVTNVNALGTIKSHLQTCLMNTMGDTDSGSLLSQIHSHSENLSALIKLANQAITSSQSQQECTPLEMNCQLNKQLASTSKEVLPWRTKIDSHVSLVNSQNTHGSVSQPGQESHITNLPECSSKNRNEADIDAVTEQSISPSQLLEIMGQDTQQNGGHHKDDEEKISCYVTVRKKKSLTTLKSAVFPKPKIHELQSPTLEDLLIPSNQRQTLVQLEGTVRKKKSLATHKSKVFPKPKVHELQSPTLEDLLIPSDQRQALVQLEDWCSSSNPSQDSSSSPAFLLSSSQNKLSSENLFSQPTLKEVKKPKAASSKIVSASSDLDQKLIMKNCYEKNELNLNDKLLVLNCESDVLCDGQSNTENEQSMNNSSSLFSDTDNDNSFSEENFKFGIKPNEGNTLRQEKNCLGVSDSELNGNGTLSRSNDSDDMKQSCDRVMKRKCGNVTNDQSQICEIDSSQMDTAGSLLPEASNMMKCEPQSGLGKLKDRCVNKKHAECCESSTQSDERKCTEISSSTEILDIEMDSAPESPVVSNSETAAILNFIDLSSTDDIYMIAGHDIDSENLVSSTDSEIMSPFDPYHTSTESDNSMPPFQMSIQTESHVFEASVDQRTTNKEVTTDCSTNQKDCAQSSSCIKSSRRIASPDINLVTSSEMHSQLSTSRGQEISRSCSATSQPGDRIEQLTCSSSLDFPLSGTVSSTQCHSPLRTSQKSSSTNLVLKSVLKNIVATINKDISAAPTTQEAHLHKKPVCSDFSTKDQECYTSLSVNPGKGKGTHLSHVYGGMNSSLKVTPCLSSVKKSASCVPGSAPMGVTVLVCDIMNGECRNKRCPVSSIKDVRIQGKRKRSCRTLFRSDSHDHLQKLDLSEIPKTHFSIAVTEIGQHAPNILEIKRLSEQTVDHNTHMKKSSAQESCQKPRFRNDCESTKHFTEIKEKDSGRLDEIQNMHQHLFVEGERRTRAKTYNIYESVSPKQERTNRENAVTKIPFCKHKKKHEISTMVSNSSFPDIPQTSPVLSLIASSSASDCTSVTSLLGSYAEQHIQENHDSFLSRPEFSFSPPSDLAIFESLGFVPSAYDDERNGHSPEVSLGFEPFFTESITRRSDDTDSMYTMEKLKQSIAAGVRYVCHGHICVRDRV